MRASRLVSALLLLQARGRLTAAQLASELEVSERTVYRDLADLGASGVPVYGERGAGGGYQLVDGYRTQLTGMTSEQASTLLLAGAPGPAEELGLGSLLAATRLKLLAAVPPGLRSTATRAEERFLLDPSGWSHQRPRDQRQLRDVARAVWQDRQLELTHQRGSDSPPVTRVMHPLSLVHKTGTWYLIAVHDGRPLVFRMDRVREARVLDAPAQRLADFQLAAFWSNWESDYEKQLPTFVVTVRLGPRAQRYRDVLGAAAPRAVTDETRESNNWVRQKLLFDRPEVALAALLALSPEVVVIDPPDLRQALVDAAFAAAALNSDSTQTCL